MPEGIGEQGQGGAASEVTPEQFMAEFGFASLGEAKAALAKYKADIPALKSEARAKRELETELEALRAAEKARQDKELTATQKLEQKLADLEKQMTERDALIAAKDRAILTERVFSSKLNGKTPEESAVLRRLLSSAVAGQTFADEAELAELLKPVEVEYETLRAKFGATQGPGLTTTGAPRSPNTTAAVKEIMGMSMQDKIRAFASAGRK
jgi:septal ring factor EnvC (AmiA/AmiB activator)